jgi:hypothetical protein
VRVWLCVCAWLYYCKGNSDIGGDEGRRREAAPGSTGGAAQCGEGYERVRSTRAIGRRQGSAVVVLLRVWTVMGEGGAPEKRGYNMYMVEAGGSDRME